MSESWVDLLGKDLERFSTEEVHESSDLTLAPGERREVAILFLDLAGFTTLSEKLDHEALHRISSGIMKALSSAVVSNGGIVDKFEGDRVMALFGATVCREDDCARAVACALRLIETLGEISSVMEKHGLSLAGRIGLNFGPVTVAPDPSGHVTALGDEVNVASRLEQCAEIGTALVTARVRDECGDLFEWQDLGEIMVRGRTKPVRTYRITGPGRIQTARIKKASRLRESVLAGRAREIELFRDFMDVPFDPEENPRGGPRHRLCVLRGEPGSGKTRLLRELVSVVESMLPGTLLLEGRVFPFGARPFSYWLSVISGLISGSSEARAGEQERTTADLVRSMSGKPAEGSDRSSTQKEIDQSVRDFVLSMAERASGILIVIDDFQWLDSASLQTLEFVLANCDSSKPLTVICAGRIEEVKGAIRPMVHENYAATLLIELSSMSEDEICTTLASMLGYDSCDELSPGLRRFIIRRSGGNPRFAREILLDLIENGTMEETGGGWLLRSSPEESRIPSSLSGAVRSRIDRLPSRLRKALQIAAVLGFEFPSDLFVRTAIRLGLESPREDLENLASLGIESFRTDGGIELVSSKDELAMKAAYDGLLYQNRALIHRCAADALLSSPHLRPGEAGIIAKHLSKAGDLKEAAEWAIRAALEASSASQDREAAAWASNALDWLESWPQSEQKTVFLLDAMRLVRESFISAGVTEGFEASLQAEIRLAGELGLPNRVGEALQMCCRLRTSEGRFQEADLLCEKGLAAAREAGDLSLEGTLLADKAFLRMHQGRMPEARTLLEQSYILLEKTGRIDAKAKILNNLGTVMMSLGDISAAKPFFEMALSLVEGTSYRSAEAQILVKMGIIDGMSGFHDKAVSRFETALAMQESVGDRREQGITLNNLGMCFMEMGDFVRAKRILRQALLIHREIGNHMNEANTLDNLGCIFLRDGDLHRARLHLEDSLRLYEASGFHLGRIGSNSNLGMVEAEAGDMPAALRRYRSAYSVVSELKVARPAAVSLIELRELLIKKGLPESDLPLPANWQTN